ncbi:MAG: hypothetical protein HYU63_04475 [Armatimonadetes bacterium]|nr:hypothetical protein [Armatimonadota bacterium]
MTVIDLTDFYIKHILEENNLEAYENSLPELFQHYFKFWASREIWHKELDRGEVIKRKNLVLSRLPCIEEKLKQCDFDAGTFQIILWVGQGTTNGHAFKYKNNFAIFLPLEGYTTEKQADIFITHEIMHAFHYRASPKFYFRTEEEQTLFLPQLITEGLATYLTKKIWKINDGEALWADYISDDARKKWLEKCKNENAELLKEVKNLMAAKNCQTDLFSGVDPSNIRKSRAGYFIGLKLVEAAAARRNISNLDLLKLKQAEFENIISAEIANLINHASGN